MKFGKQLILKSIPEWRSHYLSYKKLKRILKRLPDADDAEDYGIEPAPLAAPLLASPTLLASIERDFFALVEEDLERINAHSSEMRAAIERRLVVLQEQKASGMVKASPLARWYSSAGSGVDMRELSLAYCLCAKLRAFAALNHDGIRKIVKK